jgi:hypothetical protein
VENRWHQDLWSQPITAKDKNLEELVSCGIISWTYNAENFAIPLQNAKHLHRKNRSILYAASSRIEKLHQH